METPKTQFLSPNEEMNGENLFKELESELDLSNTDESSNTQKVKKHPLEIANIAADVLFKVLLVAAFVFGADSILRDLNSSGMLKNLPVCSYLSMGIDNYDNKDCKSYVEIKDQITAERDQYEKDLTVPLSILVPKKLESANVLSSPEVQFIQTRTTNRVLLSKVVDRLNEIKKNSTVRRGEDIECKKISFDEKGIVSLSCDCYWFGLDSGVAQSNTSRATALSFIEKLTEKNSNFQLVESPKTLDIEKYSSTDLGIKSTFSTHTTLNLKLRYVTPNKS